jgi:hypothetical protein
MVVGEEACGLALRSTVRVTRARPDLKAYPVRLKSGIAATLRRNCLGGFYEGNTF